MSRAILAVVLAALFIAPALLTVAPAAYAVVASAVASGATITVQPGDKMFIVDPRQDVLFTVVSSANAFGNNATLYYGVREAGTATNPATVYLWTTPYGVYLNNQAGKLIKGPTVSINPDLPPLLYISEADLPDDATLTKYELLVSDDVDTATGTFNTYASVEFVVHNLGGNIPPMILSVGAAPLTPQIAYDPATGVWSFAGASAVGYNVAVYKPGDTAYFYVYFPAGAKNITVYLDYVGSTIRASLPATLNVGMVELQLPAEMPMGLHPVIAVGEIEVAGQTYYVTAFTFIYVKPVVTISPNLISGAQGEQITVRGVGFPSEAVIDFVYLYNKYTATATANYYIFDVANDLITASVKGSFTATFSLVGYITDAYPTPAALDDQSPNLVAGGIMAEDRGVLTLDFFYGVPAIGDYDYTTTPSLPPVVGGNTVENFRQLITETHGAAIASAPDDTRFTATFGDEGIIVYMLDGSPVITATTVMNNAAYFTVEAGNTVVSAAIYNLPANTPFKAYIALKGEENERLLVYQGTTSSYGSAFFSFKMPMVPYGDYQLVVEVLSTPPLTASVGTYNTAAGPQTLATVLQVAPAAVGAAVSGTGFYWSNIADSAWPYVGAGNTISFLITGLPPFQTVTVSQVVYDVANNTQVETIYTATFVADAWGVATITVPALQYTNPAYTLPTTGMPYPVTGYPVTPYGIKVEYSAILRDGATTVTGTAYQYSPVGPAVVKSITDAGDTVKRNGAVAGYDTWIVSGAMPKVTPDSFTVTFMNLVPGLPYVFEVGNYKEVIAAGDTGEATTGSVPFTETYFGYGVYVAKVYDAVFNQIDLCGMQVFIAVASSTTPGTDPIGMTLFDLTTKQATMTATVKANAYGGVFLFAWNVDPAETLYVAISGINQEGHMIGTFDEATQTYNAGGTTYNVIYGMDTNGVIFIDALDVNVGTPADTTILNKPAGTYTVYLQRTYKVTGATPLYGYMKVEPAIEIVSGITTLADGVTQAIESGGSVSLKLYGFTPSTYYAVYANTVADQPLIALATTQIVGGTTLTNANLAMPNVFATDINGYAEITVQIPDYLQVGAPYYIQFAKAYEVGTVELTLGPYVILEKNSNLLYNPADAGVWSQELKTVSASASQVVEIKIYDLADFLAAMATFYVDGAETAATITAPTIDLNGIQVDIRSLSEVSRVVVKLTLPVDIYGTTYTLKVDGQLIVKEEDGLYNAYIRFVMPSLPEEALPAAEQFRVFGVTYEIYANFAGADGGNVLDINMVTQPVTVGGFVVMLGAGTLIPVETILGSLNAIQTTLDNAVAILVEVNDTVTMIYADLKDVQATLADIKDNYLTVMLDNQAQIMVKIDELGTLIQDTGEGIKLEIQNVGGEVIAKIDSAYMDLAAKQDQMLQLLDAMNATLVEVRDGVAYIATTVGTIQADVQDLQVLIADAADAIIMKLDEEVLVAIQKNGETLAQIKATLDALQPVITDVADGLAQIQTTLGTMQATLDELKAVNMEIKGMVEQNGQLLVEISTNIGTMQATLDALQGLIENQVVTGIENIAAELQALGETGQQILAATQAIQEQVAKINDIQQTLTEVRSDVADVKATVNGLEGTIQQAKDDVIGTITQQLEQLKQEIQQQTQQAAEQAQQASGTAQTWGIINAVLSLAVLAAAGYLILQVRSQAS